MERSYKARVLGHYPDHAPTAMPFDNHAVQMVSRREKERKGRGNGEERKKGEGEGKRKGKESERERILKIVN